MHPRLVDAHFLDALGQGRIEHCGRARAHKPAEFRHQACRAGWLRAACLHRLDLDGEAITLLGALHIDGPALRIEIRKLQLLARLVPLGFERAAEGIQRFDRDAVTRLDLEHGLGIRAVDIVELSLLGLAQAVMGSRFFAGAATPRHDRIFHPCRFTHLVPSLLTQTLASLASRKSRLLKTARRVSALHRPRDWCR
jgi:hypothetical protein